MIKSIEGKNLDKSQTECVNSLEKYILAVAGAGCGKTTTLLARVKFLLEEKKINKDELLILSFTNYSSRELKERIKNVTNENVDVFTFHKLGKDIINSVKKVSLYDGDVLSVVKLYFKQNLFDNDELISFLLNYYGYNKSYDEFESMKEISEFIKNNDITTLDGIYKRNYEDMRIGNFLYLNHIKYEYHTHYPFRKKEFSSIMSYFYLKDYDKYIVNLCIDKEGNPLKFIKKNLRGERLKLYYDSYINFWKRDKFKGRVIFTYYYDSENGNFLDILTDKLIENGINLNITSNKANRKSEDITLF